MADYIHISNYGLCIKRKRQRKMKSETFPRETGRIAVIDSGGEAEPEKKI